MTIRDLPVTQALILDNEYCVVEAVLPQGAQIFNDGGIITVSDKDVVPYDIRMVVVYYGAKNSEERHEVQVFRTKSFQYVAANAVLVPEENQEAKFAEWKKYQLDYFNDVMATVVRGTDGSITMSYVPEKKFL